MTKKELEQYRSIVAEIDEIRDRLNSYTVHGTVTGSDTEFPYVQHSISVGGVVETERNKRDMVLIRKLELQKQDIEDYIEAIPDSVTRRIFRYRYIDGKVRPSWQWIAFKIGGGNSADAMRKNVMRYLNRPKKE